MVCTNACQPENFNDLLFQCEAMAISPQVVLPEGGEQTDSSAMYLNADATCHCSFDKPESTGRFCNPLFRAQPVNYDGCVNERICSFGRDIASVETIKNNNVRIEALREIVKNIGETSLDERAVPLFTELIRLGKEEECNWFGCYTVNEIADAVGKSNLGAKGAEVFEELIDFANKKQIRQKEGLLKKIAYAFGKTEMGDMEVHLFKGLVSSLKGLSDWQKAGVFSSVALGVSERKVSPAALSLLESVKVSARKLRGDYDKAVVLADVASAFGKLGLKWRAAPLFDETFSIAERVIRTDHHDVYWRRSVRGDFVRKLFNSLGKSNLRADSIPFFGRLMGLMDLLPNGSFNKHSLEGITHNIFQAGLGEKTAPVFVSFIKAASKYDETPYIINFAHYLLTDHSEARTPEVFAALVDLAKSVRDHKWRSSTLCEAARILDEYGSKEEAARTYAMAISSAKMMEYEAFRAQQLREVAANIGYSHLGKEAWPLFVELADTARRFSSVKEREGLLGAISYRVHSPRNKLGEIGLSEQEALFCAEPAMTEECAKVLKEKAQKSFNYALAAVGLSNTHVDLIFKRY